MLPDIPSRRNDAPRDSGLQASHFTESDQNVPGEWRTTLHLAFDPTAEDFIIILRRNPAAGLMLRML